VQSADMWSRIRLPWKRLVPGAVQPPAVISAGPE